MISSKLVKRLTCIHVLILSLSNAWHWNYSFQITPLLHHLKWNVTPHTIIFVAIVCSLSLTLGHGICWWRWQLWSDHPSVLHPQWNNLTVSSKSHLIAWSEVSSVLAIPVNTSEDHRPWTFLLNVIVHETIAAFLVITKLISNFRSIGYLAKTMISSFSFFIAGLLWKVPLAVILALLLRILLYEINIQEFLLGYWYSQQGKHWWTFLEILLNFFTFDNLVNYFFISFVLFVFKIRNLKQNPLWFDSN